MSGSSALMTPGPALLLGPGEGRGHSPKCVSRQGAGLVLPSPLHHWYHVVAGEVGGVEPAQGALQTSIWLLVAVQTLDILIVFSDSTGY